jgi:GT2 family glycosyltransferase
METPEPDQGDGLLASNGPETDAEDPEAPPDADVDDAPPADTADSPVPPDDEAPADDALPDPALPETDEQEPVGEEELPPAAPPVVAVLVTSDASPWLEDSLGSLAAQDYPALSVLVLDNGSAEDPTSRIATTMPHAFVRRLPENVGFSAAANDAIATIEGATFLLFCHDDVVLESDAVRLMVEEAYRSNAAVVGPKLVEYERPDVLLEVGMAVDHYAVPFSGIEPGEVDQEQHDSVRDVFFVSNAVMLVRADLFKELGGFDADTFPGSDDIDLCWRARLAGARVLVVPDARVRHRQATMQDERPGRLSNRDDIKRWTTARVRVLMKSYSGLALIWVLPTAFFLNVVEAIGYVVTRRPKRGAALLSGWFATLGQLGSIWRARKQTQEHRRIDDGDVRDLMVRGSARARSLLMYRLHAGERIADASIRTRAAAQQARRNLRSAPALLAGALIFLVLLGSRSLFLDRVPQVGSLQDWPGASELWETFFGPWRYAMMGANAPSPPAFGFMAIFSSVLLGDSDLARMLVVAGAMPLGAWGAYRFTRPLSESVFPAVAAAVAYACNPIVRNAVGEGELGPLVLFALAPFFVSALLRAASTENDQVARVHAAISSALLLLAVTAFWPPALLLGVVLGFGVLIAVPFAGGLGLSGRVLLIAAAVTVGAFILCAPWAVSIVGADAATFALFPRDPLSLADVMGFQTGAAGSGFAPYGLLVAAVLPLAVATGDRLAWAVRAWILVLLSFTLAWLPGRLDVGASTPAPEGVLVPAALGIALAVALGLAAFLEELRTFHFGWRQFVAVAAAFGLALPVIGMAADTVQGRWRLDDNDWPQQLSWMEETPEVGGFRVLWLGDPSVLPTDAKIVDGIGYGLTRDGTGDARSLWAPPKEHAERVLADAIREARAGRTVRLGHLIAPAGIRYIALVERPAPGASRVVPVDPELAAGLGNQLDLAVSRLEDGATIYANDAWAARRATVPPEMQMTDDAERTDLAGAKGVGGPLDGSRPTGPGTMLWAEASHEDWSGSVDGNGVERDAAFNWTNSFQLDQRGSTKLQFDAGPKRYLVYLQLALWLAVVAAWLRTRRSRSAR